MVYDPRKHHRRSIRLKNYDYAQAGAYFITLCTQHRQHIFGQMEDGVMLYNDFGHIAHDCWQLIPTFRPFITLDAFIIMPNHLHGILIINDLQTNSKHHLVRATESVAPTRPTGPEKNSIGAIIGQYKSTVTKQINTLRKTPGRSVWQRNYYEHIVRDERSFQNISQYIQNNPQKWSADRFY